MLQYWSLHCSLGWLLGVGAQAAYTMISNQKFRAIQLHSLHTVKNTEVICEKTRDHYEMTTLL